MATGLTTGGENRRDKHRCCLPSLSPFTFAGGASPPQPRQQEEQSKGPTQSINVIIRPWTIKSSLLKSRVFHNCFATLARHDQDSCHNYLHSTWGGWTCYGSLPHEWTRAAAEVRWKTVLRHYTRCRHRRGWPRYNNTLRNLLISGAR